MEKIKKKKKGQKEKKGFTLIELLAVIIILGVLMIIAIPSVTNYIQNSRKETYISTVKEYIKGASVLVNSGKLQLYDTGITYYIPSACVSLEKGGNSPFGELEQAYIVVKYSGNNYDYYWTSRDSSNMGIYLSYESLLTSKSVISGIKEIDTTIGIGETTKITKINDRCSLENADTYDVVSYIEDKTSFDGSNALSASYRVYNILASKNKENGKMVLDNQPSRYVTSSTGINFENTNGNYNNGKGVYILSGTETNKFPIYYYRGNIDDNNVIFANFCWKIVRTTEIGGIKVVYNGVPQNGQCNNTGSASIIGYSTFNNVRDDNAYVGYMYGTAGQESTKNGYNETHANLNDSTIKQVVDNWYEEHMLEYTAYLEDTVWCNDRSIPEEYYEFGKVSKNGTGTSNVVTYYGSNVRNEATLTSRPSVVCSNENDRFTVSKSKGNGMLKYPVGLLTGDEGQMGIDYLSIGEEFWTMSPASNTYSMARVASIYGGSQYNFAVSYEYGVRPAISLKPSIAVMEEGNGSQSSPYIIRITNENKEQTE